MTNQKTRETKYRFFEQKEGQPVLYAKFKTVREAVKYAHDFGFRMMERQDGVYYDIAKIMKKKK